MVVLVWWPPGVRDPVWWCGSFSCAQFWFGLGRRASTLAALPSFTCRQGARFQGSCGSAPSAWCNLCTRKPPCALIRSKRTHSQHPGCAGWPSTLLRKQELPQLVPPCTPAPPRSARAAAQRPAGRRAASPGVTMWCATGVAVSDRRWSFWCGCARCRGLDASARRVRGGRRCCDRAPAPCRAAAGAPGSEEPGVPRSTACRHHQHHQCVDAAEQPLQARRWQQGPL